MAKTTAQKVTPSTSGSSFLAKVFEAGIRNRLSGELVVANAFTDHPYDGGYTQVIDRFTDPTVNDYAGTIDWEESELNQITYDMSFKKYIALKVGDDVEALSVHKDLVNGHTKNIAVKGSEKIDEFLAGILVENATFVSGTAATPTALTKAQELYLLAIKLKVQLDKAKVPTAGRVLIVSPEVSGLLFTDPRFTYSNAVAGEVIKTGWIGKFANFDVYMSTNLPQTTDAEHKGSYMIGTHPIVNDKTIVLDKLDVIKLQDSFDTGIKTLFIAGAQAGAGIAGTVAAAAVDLTGVTE